MLNYPFQFSFFIQGTLTSQNLSKTFLLRCSLFLVHDNKEIRKKYMYGKRVFLSILLKVLFSFIHDGCPKLLSLCILSFEYEVVKN